MIKLNPIQQVIMANVLAGLGVAAQEDVAVNAASSSGFAPGRVLEYERDAFLSIPSVAVNASQFAGNNPHEFLSQFAVRYQDPHLDTLDDVRQLLAPDCPANNSRYVDYAVYGFIDAFLSLDNVNDDIRGIGADYPTLRNPTKQIVSQRLNERGLAIEVDESEELLPGSTSEWQQEKVAFLIGIGDRTRLRRAVALMVAIATAASKTWDTTAGKDPDQDVMDELDNLPIRPTDVIFGPGAWSKRSRCHRAQVTAGGFASANAAGLAPGIRNGTAAANGMMAARDSAEQLAAILGVNSVTVARHRRATGASTISDIIGSLVMLFQSSRTPSRFDRTNLKTFRAPALGPNGNPLGQRAVYVRQVGDKRWRIAVSFGSELTTVTSAIGAEVITIS